MTTLSHQTGHAGTLATIEQLTDFTDAWLRNRDLSANTRDAYRRDVLQYLAWCHSIGLTPVAARWTHINTYARHLETVPAHPKSPKPLAKRSIARKMSALSSWYAFLHKLDAVPANPVDAADKPKIDRDHTSTVSFTEAEAAAIVAAARTDKHIGPLCAAALAETMVALGARVTELCLTTVGDLGYQEGNHTLALRKMKGGKIRVRSLPPAARAAIETMLTARPGAAADEPLFRDRDGRPLDRHMVYRFVRRAARNAGIPAAARITPHSFRHAWAAAARRAGADLEDRQHALGHADPRTTQGYDRASRSLASDPAYLVAAAIAKAATG
ncbi:tyrosine-type recombinase/integrase [Nonomuraea recticatena]|uniref:Site-specific tyrosine recombinase XerD n=1 Tax=Nonomuraea recticatena TaxID=46178 RepID=A0ABN3TA87_9ACTN